MTILMQGGIVRTTVTLSDELIANAQEITGITERTELLQYFPDLRHLAGQCRFHNCTHRKEPGCAVKQAVESGEIKADRLNFLQRITDELTAKPY